MTRLTVLLTSEARWLLKRNIGASGIRGSYLGAVARAPEKSAKILLGVVDRWLLAPADAMPLLDHALLDATARVHVLDQGPDVMATIRSTGSRL